MASAAPPRPDRRPRTLWERFCACGVYPGMPFDLRQEVSILKGVALVLILVIAVFLVVWLVLRTGPPIRVNLVIGGAGFAVLRLVSRHRYQAATILLSVTLGVSVLYQSYFFRTGAHFYLPVFAAATAFLIRHRPVRHALATAMIGGYVVIGTLQMGTQPPGAVRPARYVANMALSSVLLYGLCCLSRDLSDEYRRRLDQRNRDLAEAHAAKERIFSVIGHDLRSPIAALKGGLDLLDEGTLSSAEFAEMKADLQQGVDSVFRSLEGLLEWSATQMGASRHQPVRVGLREALDEEIDLLARIAAAKGITVENRLPGNAAVRADRHRLHAVLRNLVSNALKFTPRGGRVEVSAEAAPGRPEWWSVAVRDDGVGIDPARAASLFDGPAFHSTPGTAGEKGLGLGLQICRDFVRDHGGEIGAESGTGSGGGGGRGSVFRFTLPAWREEEAFSIPNGGPRC